MTLSEDRGRDLRRDPRERDVDTAGQPRCGPLGAQGTRLFAGPPAHHGPETLLMHMRRLGRFRPALAPAAAVNLVSESGLLGRGGGEFPFASKLRATLSGRGEPLVVVNGSEGEPASRKDRTLLEMRPHLVLDGASWTAAAIGAREAIIYLEPSRRAASETLRRAAEERLRAGLPDPTFRIVGAPARFVAGETSAVVTVLEGGGPLPRRRPLPAATCGVGGRPTLVSNTETFAHLALIARFGPGYFREAGSRGSPGSTLVTLAGAVSRPGLVVEVVDLLTVGEFLEAFGEVGSTPEAVLVGGYSGRFVSGTRVWDYPVDRAALKSAGHGLGCGVIAPLSTNACGLVVAHRLLSLLAAESSGQCGSCVFGLPTLVDSLAEIIAGGSGRRGPSHLYRMSVELEGRGGCAHPDGAIALLQSALQTFAGDAAAHARRRPCPRTGDGGWLPVLRMVGGSVSRSESDRLVMRVDGTRCNAHGICVLHCPDLVTLDERGFAGVEKEVILTRRLLKRARRAAAACPQRALSLLPAGDHGPGETRTATVEHTLVGHAAPIHQERRQT